MYQTILYKLAHIILIDFLEKNWYQTLTWALFEVIAQHFLHTNEFDVSKYESLVFLLRRQVFFSSVLKKSFQGDECRKQRPLRKILCGFLECSVLSLGFFNSCRLTFELHLSRNNLFLKMHRKCKVSTTMKVQID